VAKFLHREPLDDEQLSTLANHLDIKNFRKNSAVNFDLLRNIGLLNEGEESFIRKGTGHKYSKIYYYWNPNACKQFCISYNIRLKWVLISEKNNIFGVKLLEARQCKFAS
jgi:hypothetical protein